MRITLGEFTLILCFITLSLVVVLDAGIQNDLATEQYLALVEK